MIAPLRSGSLVLLLACAADGGEQPGSVAPEPALEAAPEPAVETSRSEDPSEGDAVATTGEGDEGRAEPGQDPDDGSEDPGDFGEDLDEPGEDLGELGEDLDEPEPLPPVPTDRRDHWVAPVKAEILALQPRRTEQTSGPLTLVDPNPAVGRWFVLRGEGKPALHLEVAAGTAMSLADGGLQVDGEPCDPWAGKPGRESWTAVCDGVAWVRRTGVGRKTALERTTDALRDHVYMGEAITVFVRDSLLKDSYLRTVELGKAKGSRTAGRPAGAPARARLSKEASLVPMDIGLVPPADRTKALPAGRWQEVSGQPGAWFSVWAGGLIPEDLLATHKGKLAPPDADERTALSVMVAFDLDQYDLDLVLGTDHPRVGWSERIPESTRIAGLPGPDGFDTDAPFARTGQVAPWHREQVSVAFTAGFKRSHGAFKLGTPSVIHRGSHYGFIEQGVVFSRPTPDLATVWVDRAGQVQLGTWSDPAPEAVDGVVHLRQFGLPLVHTVDGEVRPGERVMKWAEGNWSGSAEGRLRALRGGLCLIEEGDRRYLVYGYFTGATPSLMAWAFLSYGCSYGLLTDMNALEHTYMAFYDREAGVRRPRHLDVGMAVLDVEKQGVVQARFLDFADNRDFFTLTRRQP